MPQRICNAFTWIERVGRSKMKIGFHIVQLGGGGAERVLVLLANYFSAKGHKVYVIANKACADEYCIDSSIDKRYIDDELIAEDGPIIRNAKRIKFIRDLCRLEDIDCMISFMAEPNIRSIIACLGLRTKNIVSVRNEPAREYPGIKLTVARALFRLADCIVLQTTQAVEAFKGLEKRATIIPNPVDESFYCVRADLDSARIVTAGRLEAQKNQELLIRAFAKICDEFPETTLDIFGTGALLEHLQRVAVECGVAPQVVFHGRTKNMPLELSNAAVFVLSSDYEGMPNALMEAMAAGIPSISTDCPCGGPADLIQNGQNGLLVPPNNAEAMASALEDLLRDKSRSGRMAYESRRSMERYRVSNICERWQTAVMDVVLR